MFVTIAIAVVSTLVNATPGVSLLADPGFERGFNLTAARHPAPKIELGALRFPDYPDEPPVWRLAQWGTEHLLEPGIFQTLCEGKWVAETPGKRVVVQRQTGGGSSILLEVRGGSEHGGRYRKAGDFWPHLLIEQRFKSPIRLEPTSAFRLSFEFRIDHCQVAPGMEAGLDPGLHTAQISAYFTVHNANASSIDHGEMIWFGIPLFDARHQVPAGHYDLDIAPGGGGKFICTLEGSRFWQGNTGDGQWRGLDADLCPLLREALQIAQRHGQLKNTAPEDLALTSFNLGWEVPGPYDCAVEIRGLSLVN